MRAVSGVGCSYEIRRSVQALQVGLDWWIPTVLIAISYFVYLFHSFRGKVGAEGHGH